MSPSFPVLFLVWMVPILIEMECCIVEAVPVVELEFPSYVDDLYCRVYDVRGMTRGMDLYEQRELM